MKQATINPKMHNTMMKGAKVVPKGTIFFMSNGQLYMRNGQNFDRAGAFMFN